MCFFQTFGVENHTGDALEAAHPIPVHPVPPPPPPPPPNLPGVTTTVTAAVAPNINVKSYSSSSGPGHQNNNQFNSNNQVDNNSDTTKVVTTMKSQNHTSVNCAVKVPGVSRGQNGPNANKNNTPHPHVGGGVGANSDNCTMPKRPRTKNTSGGGPGIPPYVGITTNKNPEPVRKKFL